MNKRTYLLLFCLLIIASFQSCKKEPLEEVIPKKEISANTVQSGQVSIADARAAYEQYIGNGDGNTPISGFDENDLVSGSIFDPLWYLAKEVPTTQNTMITIVSVDVPEAYINPGFGAQLVFYSHATCGVAIELVIYQALDSTENAWNSISNNTFTGVLLSFNFCGCTSKAFNIVDGTIVEDQDFDPDFTEEPSAPLGGAGYRGDPPCWDPNKNHVWKSIKSILGDIGGFLSSGSAGAPPSGDPYSPPSNTGFPIYNNGNTGGDTGGGGVSINDDFFELEFFEGQGHATQRRLTQMIEEEDLFICAEDLYREVFQCLEANAEVIDPHETNNGLMTIQDFNRELGSQINNDYTYQCMQNVIAQQASELDINETNSTLVCAASEVRNTLGLNQFSNEDVFELIQLDEDCISETEVDLDCIRDQLFQWLNEDMDLDDNETCLQVQPLRLIDLANFYKKHTKANVGDCEKKLAAAIANTFADFYCETGNISLPLGTYDGSPADAKAYLMRESLLSALKFALPVADDELSSDIFNDLSSSSWLDVMYEATDRVLNTTDNPCFLESRMSIFSLILAQRAEDLAALGVSNVEVALGDFIAENELGFSELELAMVIGEECINITQNNEVSINETCVWEKGAVLVRDLDGGVPEVDLGLILPYSCQSFYLEEIGSNTYLTTISNLPISFNQVERLIPPKYRSYNFLISLDIEITALPGEEKCEIKNNLAYVLNEAVQDVVEIFGRNRVYLLSNAQRTLEIDLEIALETGLTPHFPLGKKATVPAENFLGGGPPIRVIPGEEDNCCN